MKRPLLQNDGRQGCRRDCFASRLTQGYLKNTAQILLGTHLLFFFSPFTPVLIQAPDNPIHHTGGPTSVRHFQLCGQLSPALPNICHRITGSLQLEKVLKIKSSHEPSTASPALLTPSQSSTRGPPQAAAPTWPICSGFLDNLQHSLTWLFQ